MYLFGGSEPALFLALLTKRMRLDVAVTDTLPGTTVSLVGSGVAFVLVVLFCNNLLMLGTVLLAIRKPTAAGISTGTFRFIGHGNTSLSGIRKALRDCSHKALLDSVFLIIILS